MPIQKIKSGRVVTVNVESFIGDKGILFYDEEEGSLRLGDGRTPGGVLIGGGAGYVLRPATATRLGGVKIGDNISVNTTTGVISVATPTDLLSVLTSIIPSQDNVYDLGSEDFKWRHLYVGSGTIFIGNIALSEVNGSLSISGPEKTILVDTTGTSLTVSEIDSYGSFTNVISNISALHFDKDTGFNVTDLGDGEVKISLGSSFKTWEVEGQPSLVAQGEDTVKFIAGNGVTIITTATAPKSIKIDIDPGEADTTTDFLFLYQISK